jgi:hypothetical protein
MAGLFKKSAPPAPVIVQPPPPPPPPKVEIPEMPKPKPVRMPRSPIGEDPNAEKAAERYRKAAMQRKGRQSTILTSALREMTGSSGDRLGE